MSTPATPPPAPETTTPVGTTARGLFDRLSLGAKLMLGGAALSVLAFVLKAYSSSMQSSMGDIAKNLPGGLGKSLNISGGGFSHSLMMFETWQGVVAFLGCLATGVLAFLLYGERPHAKTKELSLAALGASVVALLCSLILLFTLSKNPSASFSGPGVEMSTGLGLGVYLMIAAAAVCVAGSVLHARAAKVF